MVRRLNIRTQHLLSQVLMAIYHGTVGLEIFLKIRNRLLVFWLFYLDKASLFLHWGWFWAQNLKILSFSFYAHCTFCNHFPYKSLIKTTISSKIWTKTIIMCVVLLTTSCTKRHHTRYENAHINIHKQTRIKREKVL